jgi:hypothetical protein
VPGSFLPPALAGISYRGIRRIDVALEGAWSETVAPLWTPDEGFLGFSAAPAPQAARPPALELYFDGWWIGVHCHVQRDGLYLLDRDRAMAIVVHIERALAREAASGGHEAG